LNGTKSADDDKRGFYSVSAHLWAECVWMGDYYTHKDMMSFLRAEMLFTF
jgi:hypothetical protein